MRYLILTTSYPEHTGDASGHFVRSEALELAQAGHDVTVLCPGQTRRSVSDPRQLVPIWKRMVSHAKRAGFVNDSASCPDAAQPGTPRVMRLGASSLFGWPGALARMRQRPWRILLVVEFFWRAKMELRRRPADQVVAHWLIPCGWPLAQLGHSEVETVAHGSDVRLLLRAPQRLREAVVRSLLQRNSRIRFVARELKQQLASGVSEPLASRLLACEIRPCLIGVPDALSREQARELLGVPRDRFVAVCAGRLIPQKRVDVALRCPALPEGAQLTVLGDGPMLDAWRSQFAHADFLGRVTRDQCLNWIAAADVVLSASMEEGAPSVIREARALGTRVWCAPAGDVAEWAQTDPGIVLMPELA